MAQPLSLFHHIVMASSSQSRKRQLLGGDGLEPSWSMAAWEGRRGEVRGLQAAVRAGTEEVAAAAGGHPRQRRRRCRRLLVPAAAARHCGPERLFPFACTLPRTGWWRFGGLGHPSLKALG